MEPMVARELADWLRVQLVVADDTRVDFLVVHKGRGQREGVERTGTGASDLRLEEEQQKMKEWVG